MSMHGPVAVSSDWCACMRPDESKAERGRGRDRDRDRERVMQRAQNRKKSNCDKTP